MPRAGVSWPIQPAKPGANFTIQIFKNLKFGNTPGSCPAAAEMTSICTVLVLCWRGVYLYPGAMRSILRFCCSGLAEVKVTKALLVQCWMEAVV